MEKKPQESKTKLNIHLNSFIYIQCQINQELHVTKYHRHSQSCSVTTSQASKVTLRFVKANITKTCFKNNGILRNYCKRDKKAVMFAILSLSHFTLRICKNIIIFLVRQVHRYFVQTILQKMAFE